MSTPMRTTGAAHAPGELPGRIVFLRGLPSSGKSTLARSIAAADDGEVIEFDAFLYDGDEYVWSRERLRPARARYLAAVRSALDRCVSPIVLDDDNAVGLSARHAASLALARGYSLEFAEPETPWWRAIRPLLSDCAAHRAELTRWAHKLAALNTETHRASATSILRRMERWRTDLTPAHLVAAIVKQSSRPASQVTS